MATLKVIKIDYDNTKGGRRPSDFQVVIAETGEPLTGISDIEMIAAGRGKHILKISTVDFTLGQESKDGSPFVLKENDNGIQI